MGYSDVLIDTIFKKTDDGKTIFYPYGISGSGYIVSQDSEKKIKIFLGKYFLITFILVFIAIWLSKIFAIISLFFALPFYYIRIKYLLSDAKKTEKKIKFIDITKKTVMAMGIPKIVQMLIGTLLLFTGSIFMIFSPKDRIIGITGAIFTGFCLLCTTFWFWIAIKYNKKLNSLGKDRG